MRSIFCQSRVWIFLLLLTACQPKPSENKTSLSLCISEDVASFDPRLVRAARDLSVMRHLYEGLTRPDSENTATPALAKSIEKSADARHFVFHLREAVWSDGSAVTATDFVRSWKEVKDPQFASPLAYMLDPIKSVTATDTHTLVVHLDAPTPHFLDLVALPIFFPVKGELTNGPFELAEWKPGESLTLAKSGSYWDKEHVFLKIPFYI